MARSSAPLPVRLAERRYVSAGLQTGLILAALACASPAAAQVDFSGQWAPVYHEDNEDEAGLKTGGYVPALSEPCRASGGTSSHRVPS